MEAASGSPPTIPSTWTLATRAQAGWVEAGDLHVGDRVRTTSGHGLVVTSLRYQVGAAHVYTLTVATDHTFFVGSDGVLVHNAAVGCRPADLPSISSVTFDWDHIRGGHSEGSPPQIRGNNTTFHNLNQQQIQSVVRGAYRNIRSKLQTQGDRIRVRGSYDGWTVEFWVTRVTGWSRWPTPCFRELHYSSRYVE